MSWAALAKQSSMVGGGSGGGGFSRRSPSRGGPENTTPGWARVLAAEIAQAMGRGGQGRVGQGTRFVRGPELVTVPGSKGAGKGGAFINGQWRLDWECPACGDFQFGRNRVCRTCGEPSPKDREDPGDRVVTAPWRRPAGGVPDAEGFTLVGKGGRPKAGSAKPRADVGRQRPQQEVLQ